MKDDTHCETAAYHLAASDLDDPFVTRAMALLNSNRPKAALEFARSQARSTTNVIASKYLGCATLAVEGPAAAKKHFRELHAQSRHDTDAASALSNLGECAFREGRAAVAFELARRAIDLDPQLIIPWFTAAESIVKIGTPNDVERFVDAFQTALPDLMSRPAAGAMFFGDSLLAPFRASEPFRAAYQLD